MANIDLKSTDTAQNHCTQDETSQSCLITQNKFRLKIRKTEDYNDTNSLRIDYSQFKYQPCILTL